MTDTLLVTGASGKFGQTTLRYLLDTLKVSPRCVIAVTRTPDKLRALAERGVTVRAADFDDPASLPAAFSGAQRMLLISTDAFHRVGVRGTQHRNAVRAAEQAGVQHVIYTSMPNCDISPILIAPDHSGTEQALRESTLPGWTVLRNNWYFEEMPMLLVPAIAAGKLYTVSGEGRIAYVSRDDDLAPAAATVLASEQADKQIYTLNGPQAISNTEMVKMIGDAVGRSIDIVEVPVEEIAPVFVAAGMSREFAEVLASFELHTQRGLVAEVTDDLYRITGRPPRSLADWLPYNKALFLPG